MSETAPWGNAPQPPETPAWNQPLEDLERLLREAGAAISRLRWSLEAKGGPPAATAGAAPAVAPTPAEAPSPKPEVELARATFERLWERIDHERLERQTEAPPEQQKPSRLRGLDLLPQQYLVTVEDREAQVDLVPLQRALLGFADMEDISLVSFANGMPVISLRIQGEIESERLGAAIGTAMDRECEVIDQGNSRLFLRLQPREDGGG